MLSVLLCLRSLCSVAASTMSDTHEVTAALQVCGAWKEVYGIVPYHDWAKMPDKYKKAWDSLDCNSKWSAFAGWHARLHIMEGSSMIVNG